MNVLITGALGTVGRRAVKHCLKLGCRVTGFDIRTARNRRLAGTFGGNVRMIWGDLRNLTDIRPAVRGQDAVIHLAAVIPPLADREPGLAGDINVRGTANVVEACEALAPDVRLVYSSSIAVYGDRRDDPFITHDDPARPNEDDTYARQKLAAERIISESSLDWTIFRLSYIVAPENLKMHPLMFEMPLDTCLEICDAGDTGGALAAAVGDRELTGKTLHLAGGVRCRISYGAYLNRMMEIFGLGRKGLPEEAFSTGHFHCGFMDTEESERHLHYQKHTLPDFFGHVARKFRARRFFVTLIRPLARIILLRRSPYWREHAAGR
jgi:nucleoside-diphosphate-sugar epimerase